MTQHNAAALNAAALIATSTQTASIKHVTCESREAAESLVSELQSAWDGETDSVEGGRRIDVWGWTEKTPTNKQDWLVYLHY